MADEPSSKGNDQGSQASPEMLKPKEETVQDAPETAGVSKEATKEADKATAEANAKAILRRRGYRTGHKATIIGVAVVAVILAVNGGIIFFIIKKQTASQVKQLTQGQVTINQGVLDKLGVNRSSIGDDGVVLTINPETKFGGKVQVGGDLTVAGKLSLNSDFTAPSANFAKLQGGDTALAKLNVNGDTTMSNVNLRGELVVTGNTRLQGPVTISQLVTANNLNVANNLSIGGVLSANNFHTGSLTVDSVLNINGHIVTTGGGLPTVAPGGGNVLGSNGTIAMSGTDVAGTVSIAVGVGATAGTIGTVTFRTPYSATPRVVVSPVGNSFGGIYINRSRNGFTIVTNSAVPPGGYAFDYIVIQ